MTFFREQPGDLLYSMLFFVALLAFVGKWNDRNVGYERGERSACDGCFKDWGLRAGVASFVFASPPRPIFQNFKCKIKKLFLIENVHLCDGIISTYVG